MATKGESQESMRRGSGADGGGVPIPPRLEAKLTAFQQRLWSVKLAESALAGLVALALSYLGLFVLDRFLDTPLWLRAALLTGAFLVPLLGLPFYWHRWVRQQRSLVQVARLLRRRFPRLGDEMLGIVELSEQREGSGSRELVAAAMRQVDERVHAENFDAAVPPGHYRLWRRSAALALGLSALLLGIVTEAAQNALVRWVSPWKPVERYTFARLEPLAERLVVPYAEGFELNPRLSDESEWRPRRATLRLPGRTLLESERDGEERYGFAIPPRRDPGRLDLRVGDERRRIELSPVPRPELTDLAATVRLPDYLRYASDPVVPVRGGSVSLLAGASVSFAGTTSRPLARAEASGLAVRVEGNRFETASEKVGAPVSRIFSWEDEHGLVAKSPLELQVLPVEDQAPELVMRQLGSERVVLENEVVSFDVRASDDFGVRHVGLEWRGERPESAGEKTVAAGEPERRQVEARATFSAAREGVAPQTLHLRAFVEDYLPDRERVHSPTFTLHVLSREDHADWIGREFAKWFRNAREVYEREQQLHDGNRALRALPPEELEGAETRRRLLEQASDESANARRLEAIVRAGRELIGQAAKNDDFEADRLETWAEMMRRLDEIALERMPSVAELLQSAARAEGGAKPDEGGEGEPGAEGGEAVESDEAAAEATAGSTGAAGTADGAEAEQDAESETAEGAESVPGLASGASDETDAARSEEGPEAGASPSLPSLSDREAPLEGTEQAEAAPGADGGASPPPLGLPGTTLAAEASEDGGEEPPDSLVAQRLDQAIVVQRELLEAFAKVADELQQILSNLEASTFVKRLKAASRRQGELASGLNRDLQGSFGLPKSRIEQRLRDLGEETAEGHEKQSELVYHIQSDLEAYYQRKQDPIFNDVLQQMKESSVVASLKDVARDSAGNFSGRSIASSEFWADTLDRWAEELVAAADEGAGGQQDGEQPQRDGLPPELVLEVMKALQEQIYLRDETREMESARPGFDADVYASKVRPLELSQEDLYERVEEVVTQIGEIPGGEADYGNEIQLLTLVSDVMRQSRGVLARPDTGPETIAAQTEAIELLLQSNRQPPGGGGGGGGGGESGSGGGGGGSGSGGSALTDIGAAAAGGSPSSTDSREVDQATGRAGRELPEEFRRGLDQYFNSLDSD